MNWYIIICIGMVSYELIYYHMNGYFIICTYMVSFELIYCDTNLYISQFRGNKELKTAYPLLSYW